MLISFLQGRIGQGEMDSYCQGHRGERRQRAFPRLAAQSMGRGH